ncbi:MAG: DUF1217 domain-containing protein [Tabrizicola sp.]|jgi:hypothetical protein|nr:DUF1217 domain-containing protein [Tabrizicola sp.]
MSFQPLIPTGGFAGWAFLKRTQTKQEAAWQAAPAVMRDETYFRQKIGSVKTADDLVGDRRLLRVALTAFGLQADIDSKAFIRKVLADGTLKEGALANRLADKRYREFSAAFGFGDFSVPRTQLSDFADKMLSRFRTQGFETAVGEQNPTMRLALNAEREIPAIASGRGSEDAKWFTLMGNRPLREMMQTALGLPSSFATLDIDRQLATLKVRSRAVFGAETVSQFQDPKKLDALVRTYLVRAELSEGAFQASGAARNALQLLGNL